jgi:hypothetical protein
MLLPSASRQAEVRELDVTATIEEDIVGFDVTGSISQISRFAFPN